MTSMIFTPSETSVVAEDYLLRRRTAAMSGGLAAGVPLYISGIDAGEGLLDRFLPLLPGEMTSIIARPGGGKTSFMMRWARRRAHEIQNRAAQGDEDAAKRVVVYVTLEQTVEELAAFNAAAETGRAGRQVSITEMALGRLDDEKWEAARNALASAAVTPLWFVGYSPSRKIERFTLEQIFASLDAIAGWNKSQSENIVDVVFVDYLQRIPYKGADKTEGISNNLDAIKHYAMSRGIPVVLGAQARRECDNRDDQTPQLDDGQHTSNIEQACDKVIALMRPCMYIANPKIGEIIHIGGQDVLIKGYSQMVMAVLKQKLGKANWRAWLTFDPRYNELEEANLRGVSLEET